MKVLIIGAAGVIGSALTEKFLKMGMDMSCLDICRIDEAWRLNNVRDQIKYIWKASNDLLLDDIRGIDVIVDSGIGVADRPLGTSSPTHTFTANLVPSLRVLETVSKMDTKKPTIIYPSSFNTLYGHPAGSTYVSKMLPNPSSVYGWTKAAAELLYSTYHKAHGVPCVITRVGSGYGARMRSDEFPARLILNVLKGRDIIVRSPNAKRLWTFGEDIIEFYTKLIEDLDQYVGQTLHCAGNAGNNIVKNTTSKWQKWLQRLVKVMSVSNLYGSPSGSLISYFQQGLFCIKMLPFMIPKQALLKIRGEVEISVQSQRIF